MADDISTKQIGAVQKRVIDEGSGIMRPRQGSLCTVHITTTADSLPSEDDIVGYPVNTKCEICLDTGVGTLSSAFDQCLESMKAGERCEITFSREMMIEAVGSGTVMTDYTWWIENEQCTYAIHLLSFQQPVKEVWEMTSSEKLSKALSYKALGTRCFKESKTRRAEWFYLLALKYVIASGPEKDVGDSVEYHNLKLALSLNVAACKLKMKQYQHVIVHCTNALDVDASSVKALFRRGQALAGEREYGLAKSDFEKALELEPNNRAVLGQLKMLNEKVKRIDNHYATVMSKMFGSPNTSNV